ncbi:flagellar basal body M-ring protein FliF [Pseudazoarcus pumilus]|uniref:Flagellar M-ring protein n=2 Tax=Pseudazoarcus pumilus TaxID=2067960 RepID=A0A2I6S8E6_9RHOO|nr:flagellar basal body M-ring protein FliF [Pseudazoarcus pumilus]
MPLFARACLHAYADNAAIRQCDAQGNPAMAAADTATTASPQQMLQQLNNLSQRQKLAGAAAIALAVALVVGTLLWTRAPDYAVLFANLEERDGGAIVTALQQRNVPYRIGPGGSAIMVPSDRVHDVRLQLAAEGLPKGGLVGFEVMENQRLGVSQFLEQVNYQRALEGELSRTVQSISSVAAARVHLAMPKQSGFLRDEQRPSASVMVSLYPGRVLDGSQIAGIVHLVSSSVPKLSNDDVSVVDQNGDLLTRPPGAGRDAALDATQLSYVRELEATYLRRVEALLEPLVGAGNFRAQVAADVDFSRIEETAESFTPNPAPEQAIRSQQTSEQFSGVAGPGGVPGALTNQPPVPAEAPIVDPDAGEGEDEADNRPVTRNRSATLNYELDRNIQHIRHATGQVRKLSVAVVVRDRTETMPNGQTREVTLTPEQMQRITALVRGAIGFDEARGDVVQISSAPFAAGEVPEPVELPLWKDPEIVEPAKLAAKYLALALALAFAYFGVIRPLMRTLTTPPQPAPGDAAEAGAGTAEGDEGATQEDFMVKLSNKQSQKNFDARLSNAREMAQADPKAVANLIRSWMNPTGNEEKRK